MKLQGLLIIVLLLSAQTIYAAKKHPVSKQKCAGVDKKIGHTTSQLRAGYTLKKGEALKKKLRRLEKQKYACSMKRFSTK